MTLEHRLEALMLQGLLGPTIRGLVFRSLERCLDAIESRAAGLPKLRPKLQDRALDRFGAAGLPRLRPKSQDRASDRYKMTLGHGWEGGCCKDSLVSPREFQSEYAIQDHVSEKDDWKWEGYQLVGVGEDPE